MKTASTMLHLIALSACLATQLHISGELRMPGVRRALETMSGASQRAATELSTEAGAAAHILDWA